MSRALTLPNLFLSPENSLLGGSSSFAMKPPCKAPVTVRAFAVTETPRRRTGTSLYEVLQVNRNASQTEIKTAYRTLAKLYHPDAAADDSASDGLDFIQLHNAYATLSDPSARALYDLSLGLGRSRVAASSPFGFYPSRRWETDQCW